MYILLFQLVDLDNDNLYSLWSLNDQLLNEEDNGEAKKADWKAATGLLSSLDLCRDSHLGSMLSNLLVDSNSDMSLTMESWESSKGSSQSEAVTTFNDIEQLCIRMAEHALDISGKGMLMNILILIETYNSLQTTLSSPDGSFLRVIKTHSP